MDPASSLPTGRIEDRRFLTGRGTYVADVDLDRQLHAVLVRSDHAHGVLKGIDASAARAMPGVVAVHTGADLAGALGPLPCVAEVESEPPLAVTPRHALAIARVRHVGDPVALVLAETEAQAADAAVQVTVDVEPLPAVVDPLAALEPAAPRLWDQTPGNLAFRFHKGDEAATEAALAGADHLVELELVNNRVCAVPTETRAGIAEHDPGTGRFTLTCNAQGLHAIRDQLATVFGLPPERLWLRAPDVGGGFGLKNFLYPEWVLLLWAARTHGRPVKWVETRAEQFLGAAHGRDMRARGRLALDRDGRFLALRADVVANMGAYLSGSGPNVSTRAFPTAMGGVYDIPAMFMEARGVFTNTAPVDAYRGAGKPEANYLVERLVDAAARRCGFDPVSLRTRNAIARHPHRTAFGTVIDCGRVKENIEAAAVLSDRAGFASRRAESQAKGELRGYGLACFLETARGNPRESAEVRFTDDGAVELRVGTESQGQGHETTFSRLAAERLGVALEAVRFVQADTDRVHIGFGHGGARSMHMGGAALVSALDGALARGREAAAGLLQCEPAALRFDRGQFRSADGGSSVSLLETAAAARAAAQLPAGEPGGLDSYAEVNDAPFTLPNGCHVAEVCIDPETGAVRLAAYTAVDDYGAVLDEAQVRAQVRGGVTQGIGQALSELAAYDASSGQLLSGSLMDYAVPHARDLPALRVNLEGTATGANPLGVKGCGQAGAIAAPQTVMSAVLDALADSQVHDLDMPATAERVWRALRRAAT